ncbi:hypothetical protein DQ244_16800 [Blastococcus sp. TBT05-19]|uniref:hypothetical protein n=1 Tax=Blastococcus sp. TBT05-19 TaxID=2250581 RepID=UPI000DEA9048|nr:hypothetical protein [Blastococcus sp. TBT05-19]RBY88199.1 hypothetical protein DQ244_16800 [Blastococcus sp. TBT05-19]
MATGPVAPRDSARGARGLGAALVSGLVVAYPLAWMASIAHAEFSGCWLSCGGDPRPASGLAWSVVVAVLLAVPLASGLAVARVRSWGAWTVGVLLVLGTTAAWAAFSLAPGNADFFVGLGG